jgi:hypothetical protein
LAFFTKVAPRPPLAPGLLSITKLWPSDSCSFAATVRAVMSEEPPGVKGTTMLTVRSGYCWASAPMETSRPAAASRRRWKDDMGVSPGDEQR